MPLTKDVYRANFEIKMQRDTDTESRNIYFDCYTQDTSSIASGAQAISQSLVGGYNKLIQPTGWRDADDTEEAWTTVGVTPVIEHTTTTTYDEIVPPTTSEKKTLSYQ